MLNPRSLATLGVGFSVAAMATLGVTEIKQVVEQKPVSVQSSGGVGGDAGTGYVYIDHAWVKALKVVKIKASWQSAGSVQSGGFATNSVRSNRHNNTFNGSTQSVSSCAQIPARTEVLHPQQTLNADSFCISTPASAIVSVYNGSSMSIGADELLAIMDWM